MVTSQAGIRAGTTASPCTPSTSRFPISSLRSAGGSSLTASPSSWGRSSGRSSSPSARGAAAASSVSGRRCPPSWPPPPCPSCSTTRSPSMAETCSRRWRGSTPIPSACRWRCCFSGSSPVPSGRAGTAAGPPSSSPSASSRTWSEACTPWPARRSSRWSSSCRPAGGSATRRCTSGAATTPRCRCPGPAFCGGPVRQLPSDCCSPGGGSSPSDWSTRTHPPWGTRTWRAGPSTSEKPMHGLSSWPPSGPSRPS